MIDNLLWININWMNKIWGNSWNFIYKIDIPKNIVDKLTHVSITNVNIPKWWYTIQNNYNEFHFTENNVMIDVFIPIGNYWKNQFFWMISSLMSSSWLNWLTYVMWDYIWSYDTGLIKIIAWNNTNNYQIQLIFNDWWDVWYAFGFNQYSTNNFNNNILIWQNIINLNYANNILIHSNWVISDINDINSNDILCNVYCWSFQNFSYITQYFDIISNMKKFKWPSNNFTFYFSNEDNDIIDFNNVELWFTINFFTYTPLEKIYKLLDWYWKMKIAEKL